MPQPFFAKVTNGFGGSPLPGVVVTFTGAPPPAPAARLPASGRWLLRPIPPVLPRRPAFKANTKAGNFLLTVGFSAPLSQKRSP